MAAEKNKIENSILENGLCFIEKAIAYLEIIEKNDSKKDELKYAICHLFSGIFLILKERLCCEHWTLLFDKISEANEKKFYSGDFRGLSFTDCQDRLSNILSIEFKDEEKKTLKRLRKERNKAEHFFITNFDLLSYKSLLYNSLKFVIEFIEKNMASHGKCEKVKGIKENMVCLDTFIKSRLREISPIVNKRSKPFNYINLPFECLTCGQKALVFEEETAEFLECLFCLERVKPDQYSDLFECQEISGFGKEYISAICHLCGEEDGIVPYNENGPQSYYCLYCDSNLDSGCESCGIFFVSPSTDDYQNSKDLCPECHENRYEHY